MSTTLISKFYFFIFISDLFYLNGIVYNNHYIFMQIPSQMLLSLSNTLLNFTKFGIT